MILFGGILKLKKIKNVFINQKQKIMSEFKGTRGEVKISQDEAKDCFIIEVNDGVDDWGICATLTGFDIDRTNANLIIDAFKVRQKINCELSELLEAMEDVLNCKHEFEECAGAGHLIPYNKIIEFNQLIKKVKDNE